MSEDIKYQGRILEIVELPQPNGKVFEIARRAPGVRLIIPSADGKRLLMTREFRHEADGYDYRLPGGKVFDKLTEYNDFRASRESILPFAESKAKGEGLEETGLVLQEFKHYVTANCGATVDWDLYYFEITKFEKHADGQQLEEGEDIAVKWLDLAEVKAIIAKGEMQEYRSAGVLAQWLLAKGQLK